MTMMSGKQARKIHHMTQQPHAIFIDEDQDILGALHKIFDDEPYTVLTAASPGKALELIEKYSVRVVFCNYAVRGADGIEFIREVNTKFPDRVCVLFTGHPNINLVERVISRCRVFRIVNRPWDSRELKLTISRALRHYDLVNYQQNTDADYTGR